MKLLPFLPEALERRPLRLWVRQTIRCQVPGGGPVSESLLFEADADGSPALADFARQATAFAARVQGSRVDLLDDAVVLYDASEHISRSLAEEGRLIHGVNALLLTAEAAAVKRREDAGIQDYK